MGWLFSTAWPDKSTLIKHLCEENGVKTLAKCVRGNVLYTVHVKYGKEDAPENRFIGVYLMESNNARGEGWGYKDMCESMHPYNYGCPIAYLDMCPNVECQEWRDKVRAEHKRKSIKLRVGDTVQLIPTCTPSIMEIACVKPLTGVHNGNRYRLPRRYIAAILPRHEGASK